MSIVPVWILCSSALAKKIPKKLFSKHFNVSTLLIDASIDISKHFACKIKIFF